MQGNLHILERKSFRVEEEALKITNGYHFGGRG